MRARTLWLPRDLNVEIRQPEAWEFKAACAGRTAEMFPEPSSETRGKRLSPDERRSLAICSSCPVIQECLTSAITHNETQGTRGGILARERRGASVGGSDTEHLFGPPGGSGDLVGVLEWARERAEREGITPKGAVA